MSDETTPEPFSLELPVASALSAREDAKGNPWKLSGRLFNLAKEKLLASVKLPTRDEVLKVAGEAFDKYVAPIDVPVVPNMLEPAFDAMMREVFVDSIGKLYDLVAKAKAVPA